MVDIEGKRTGKEGTEEPASPGLKEGTNDEEVKPTPFKSRSKKKKKAKQEPSKLAPMRPFQAAPN